MLRAPPSDFWRVGVLPRPIAAVNEATLAADRDHNRITWLPDAGPWRYLADPFGLHQGGTLHVFVEAYDYRTKHAVIERHALRADNLAWQGCHTVLAQPFHLSYPLVLAHGGEVFMVPESHQAGEIALYRAQDASLDRWVRECALLPGVPGAEASLVQYQGRWWMFYTVVGAKKRDKRELHIAHSPRLTGPWQALPGNPVLVDMAGARPGGTPFIASDGALVLPVQDCSQTYGGALRQLRFERLSPQAAPVFSHLPTRLTGDLASRDHTEGLHTLSACGERTLLDVKRIDHAHARRWLDLQRRARRLWRRVSQNGSSASGAPATGR